MERPDVWSEILEYLLGGDILSLCLTGDISLRRTLSIVKPRAVFKPSPTSRRWPALMMEIPLTSAIIEIGFESKYFSIHGLHISSFSADLQELRLDFPNALQCLGTLLYGGLSRAFPRLQVMVLGHKVQGENAVLCEKFVQDLPPSLIHLSLPCSLLLRLSDVQSLPRTMNTLIVALHVMETDGSTDPQFFFKYSSNAWTNRESNAVAISRLRIPASVVRCLVKYCPKHCDSIR